MSKERNLWVCLDVLGVWPKLQYLAHMGWFTKYTSSLLPPVKIRAVSLTIFH